MRTSIATVCLSGTLTQKMQACAAAGFDGIEVFEPDLVAAPESPEEIHALSRRLGLTLDLFQPFRDAEGVDPATFAANLRRAEAKLALMRRLGMDTMLVCSNVATATIDDDAVFAAQLRELGDLAASYDVRLAYEALAWGRFVDDYRRAWQVVERADHPNVGVCLDSFHILSRGHDPKEIEQIPGDKVFFLQLADAPLLSMDVLSWSRHHRLFPGEGGFDLAGFLAHVLRAGYAGPLSLEVFNDTFRQTDPDRTARQALRSLRWLEDQAARHLGSEVGPGVARLPDVGEPSGVDFVEVRAEDAGEVEVVLAQLGFTFRGRHRSKAVGLWTQGEARVVLNEQQARGAAPAVAAVGVEVTDPDASAARANRLLAPPVHRRTYAGEERLAAFSAPDGTEVFLGRVPDGPDATWTGEFRLGTTPAGPDLVTHVDHVNLVQPWQHYDEAVLFYSSVLGLAPQAPLDVAGPAGLVRSKVMRSADGRIRLALNLQPAGLRDRLPQHVAFACDDVVTLAQQARARGLRCLPVPDNYYDDLAARFDLDPALLATLRDLGLLYDRDGDGEFLHFYTATVGRVFFEVVERRGGYDGYGAANAPVRLAAQLATA
ncbi:sugar phosphate isomerase/epimerase and 4-hydroxyphenylpyruvate domain-containing protein [Nocardioides guangzhouensis]|uniref:3-dehydroshikimate dehydratase n=1 Tax=Nocardioides guangzhouensis TaxID=2497878 RepID=A0A4Q4ZHR1_9ACTN|nr:sugar phosphate isomerase/epimerase and 4-hydroxyphenylpyruvate domain-containing protein [Nocardioides guangzhouensis]RYP87760.1 sugar phosphate isomerase/epimerase and 4-hydroxyphenylpyruvate domain-containing protein [Nocardioides guangzhouensis]